MSVTFDDLLANVAKCEMKTVAVAVAQDTPVLEAVKAAKERNIANAILVGDEEKIREIDINTLTPIEAMNFLFELKKLVSD